MREFPAHEDTPGPGAPDLTGLAEGRIRFRPVGDPEDLTPGRLILRVIRDELAALVARRTPEDPHLHHLDGRILYGEQDTTTLPLPDDLHPDAETHRLMGERFADRVFKAKGAFAL